MAKVGELNAIMRTDISGLHKGFKGAEKSITGFAGRFADWGKGLGTSLATGFSAAAGTFIAQGLTNVISSVTVQLTELTKAGFEANRQFVLDAKTIGISASELAAYSAAARMAGVDAERFATVWKEVGLRAGEGVRDRTGAQYDAFKMLGLDFDAFAAMKQVDQLRFIMKTVSQMTDQQQKQYFLDDVGGGEAAEFMLPFFDQDPSKLDAIIAKYEELGLLLSDEQSKAIAVSALEVERLQGIWQMFGQTLAAEAAPYIYAVTEAINDFVESGGNWGDNLSSGLQEATYWFGMLGDGLQDYYQKLQVAQMLTTQFVQLLVDGAMLRETMSKAVSDPFGLTPESSTMSYLKVFREELEKTEAGLRQSVVDSATGPKASASIDKWLEDTGNKFRQAMSEWNTDNGASASMFEKRAADASASSMIANLQKQVDLLTMSAEQAEILKLEKDGADLALITEIEGLQHILKLEEDRLRIQEERHKATEDELKTAQSYFDSIRTDEEKMSQELQKFREFANATGFFNDDQRSAIENDIRERFLGAATESQNPTIGNATFGSSAAANAILEHQAGRSIDKPDERAADAAEVFVDEIKGLRRDLKPKNPLGNESLEAFAFA